MVPELEISLNDEYVPEEDYDEGMEENRDCGPPFFAEDEDECLTVKTVVEGTHPHSSDLKKDPQKRLNA